MSIDMIITAIEKAKKQSQENSLDRIMMTIEFADKIVELLKEQQEKIRQLESMNVSASGNGTAIGVLHGGMTIKKEYHQQAKEVYNIGHVDRLDL